MALRGKKPEDRPKRLKCLLYGPAGVGKTMAAIQMPNPYVIDTEAGSVHYGETIEASGGAVFETADLREITAEVRELMTTKHKFRTLVIDPMTVAFDSAVEEGERLVGTEWGRHYGYANTAFRRLFAALQMLDMNLIMTAHAKAEYAGTGSDRSVIGSTFDGWKKADYGFDIVFELQKRGAKRIAVVRKTRLAEFPDGDSFEWSFDALADRYGRENLTREVVAVTLATDEQVTRFGKLTDALNIPSDDVVAWLKKEGVETLSDLTGEKIEALIARMTKKLKEVSA